MSGGGKSSGVVLKVADHGLQQAACRRDAGASSRNQDVYGSDRTRGFCEIVAYSPLGRGGCAPSANLQPVTVSRGLHG